MSMLRKDAALFERDDKEELIPVKVTLDTKAKEEILVKPMPRGAIRKAFAEVALNKGETTRDQDKEVILKYCVDPKFTEEEVDRMRFYLSGAISAAIFDASGVKEKTEIKGEDDLKKS